MTCVRIVNAGPVSVKKDVLLLLISATGSKSALVWLQTFNTRGLAFPRECFCTSADIASPMHVHVYLCEEQDFVMVSLVYISGIRDKVREGCKSYDGIVSCVKEEGTLFPFFQ